MHFCDIGLKRKFEAIALKSAAICEGGAALFAAILTYVKESEAKCEGGAALFAAILTYTAESEAKCEGGAALFAAILNAN